MNKLLRILHLPKATGNNALTLSKAEKKIGHNSITMIINPTIYSNLADITMHFPKYFKLGVLKKLFFVIKNLHKVDVVHYNAGEPLIYNKRNWLNMLDVKIFKKMNKVIAVTYQGSDARQGSYVYEHLENFLYDEVEINTKESQVQEFIIRRRINKFEELADLIYTTQPDLLHVLPKKTKYRPLTKLYPQEINPCFSNYAKQRLKIFHAPSNRKIKGTKYIDDTITRLKQEGYDFEYVVIQNIPNEQAFEMYKEADLFIDQLLVGWYGGASVELMALGKPVMCYIREEDMKFIPKKMNSEMPIIRVTIHTLYEKLKYYIENKIELENISKLSRKYVEKWHDPDKIVVDILDDYNNALEMKKRKS